MHLLLASASERLPNTSVLAFLLHYPLQRLRDARRLRSIRDVFPSPAHARDFARAFQRLRRLQAQVSFFRGLKRFMTSWRVFHVVLAVLLVVVIAAHIGVSLFLGYRWIFT